MPTYKHSDMRSTYSPAGSYFSPRSISRLSAHVKGDKWHAYSQALVERNIVSGFAVIGLKNFREWTATTDFRVSQEEVRAIVAGFSDETKVRFEGISLNNTTFTFTRMTCQRLMMVGRSSATGSGCVLYLCQTCLLIAVHEEGPQTSLCFCAIEKLGDFLKEHGF